MTSEATKWFSQFDPEVLTAHGVKGNEQWCVRHWAPCPVLNANGVKASIMLLSRMLSLGYVHPEEPICCQLGDDVMYDIWGKCPPAGHGNG